MDQYHSCHHDTRNKIGSRLVTIKKSPFKGFFQKMGNKLSCSCGPLKIKGYRFDDPWAANPRTRRDGHLLRLWAEVFHVTTSGSGTVKWQQVSEDLVPVNIACVADDPQLVFHITAYNSQVDKILDVRLVQPGTRIGQASECFVYWKDPATSDTWGLNFTSPIDAKQFRECCDGSRSNSSSRMRAKAASSRSTPASPSRSREPQCTCSHPDTLGGKPRQPHPEHRMRAATSCGMASGMNGQAMGNGNGSNTLNSVKRKPQSTPSSPTRDRKVQCTCMTPEQFAHLHRYQYASSSRPDLKDIGKECTCHGKLGLSETEPSDHKHKGSGTLSRNQGGSREDLQSGESRDSRVSTAANSQSSSVYDNVKESQRRQEGFGSVRDRRNIRGSQRDIQDSGGGSRSSHGRPRHGASTGSLKLKKDLLSKSVDYSDMDTVREGEKGVTRKQRSKSIDHLNQSQDKNCRFDSRTLKKLLTPVGAVGSDSPLTSPETGRRASGRRVGSYDSDRDGGFMSEPEIVGRGSNRGRRGRGAHFDRDIGRPSTGNNAAYRKKAKEKLFLDFQDGDGATSPSSDVAGIFENQCYATTPSSSNGGESDFERDDGPDSPTSRLLMEYEEHLRNTLEKGMDAESYSLHTFEALLTQSMENLESILGERSRNIARIKRDQFQRGVSCIEPLPRERPSLSRGVSWIDSQPEDSPTPIRNTTPVRGPSPKRGTSPNLGPSPGKENSPILRTSPSSGGSPNRRPSPHREPSPVEIHSSDSGENSHSMARSRTAENLKLKDLISIRRGSGQIDQKPKDQLTVSGLNPLNLRSKDRPTLVRGVSCMEPIPKPRGFLTRGASCSTQQHPMTPERPPMNRGASCQAQRVFPAITITRPFSAIEDGRPKKDLLSAVSEIHDQFKDTSIKPSDDEFTEDETEDEFHEFMQGDKDRAQTLPGRTGLGPGQQRPMIGRPMSVNSSFDSHTSHNHNPHPRDTSFARDSSFDSRRSGPDTGYYSDRNEAARNGYRDERGYLSDHSSRGLAPNYRQDSIRSGYISDHESRSGYERGGLNAGTISRSSDGVHQQASIESMQSSDSRLCYLTSSEISDDDRMSLTTAVSEDDDAESVHNSPYKAKQSGSAASFNCTGAVRKAGFLSVKKWLLRKKHQVELARKRGWKGYWVCLKGTTLLFYPCDSREGRSVEATPKHLIIVDGAILQPIPEHPKRDFIFCLSTAFGDAYLFQAPCQVELENWVNSIHSACAAAFARHRGKTGTLHLLQEEIYRLEKGIESDQKLKHMAELQISVVADPASKHQIQGQIGQWEENLERLQVEQFRLRCYMASLQTGELPNPKGVLTQISRPTKSTLNRLGVFTVSSLHAYICARSPSLLNNLLAGRGATKRRAPMLSRSNSASGRRSLQGSGMNIESDKHVQVTLPDHQLVTVFLRDAMTVEEFLAAGCIKKGLSPVEHFIRVKKRRDMPNLNYFVPHRSDLIETYLSTHEVVEVCGKILYQVELARNTLDIMWGFSVEAELVENSEKQDELCCYVSRVEERSVAMDNGIIKGDEIMVINGAIVSDLDMMYIESVLQEEMSLCMMMRSSRTEPPDLTTCVTKTTDDMIESLVCPPPPSDSALNEEAISSLIVPAPKWNKENVSPDGESTAPPSDRSDRSSGHMTSDRGSGIIQSERGSGHIHSSERDSGIGGITIGPITRNRGSNGHTGDMIIGNQPPLDVDALLRQQQARQAADGSLCRSPIENRKSSPTGSDGSAQSQQLTPSRQLTDAEKMRKVVIELVETERTYVKHLSYLMKTYLEPLKKETFLSNTEINALFGNIQEIYGFQQQFLQTLENALETEAQFYNLDSPSQFKNILFSIGSAFLYYVNHFKLYSSFCASHSKAQKVLHPNEGNQALQEFLMSCNPKQQHSTALESYLIKPIQRILKYPLLLTQLKNLTDPNSDEHQHLIEALIGMEKVAEHINEMQRIHEEYGAIFDHLFRQHQKSSKQPIDLSPGDLLYYGGVEWLNISDFLGKIKKGLELHAMCFVFKTAVVFLCKERLRQKKKSIIGSSSKSSAAEVEIIRYQVLIPVTEVQVRASTVKDVDSHYLWELIHLKSQIQRRNEKVYHLSNSTSEFRNAFLKTIRQIIRESVRNMSLPPCDNLRKPEPPMRSESTKLTTAVAGSPIGHTAQTLQLNRKKTTGQKVNYNSLQRHSSGNIDYDNVENCTSNGNGEFGRGSRSRTLGDGLDELADLAINSESDSVRDEGSSGMRSEGEDDMERKMPPQNGRKPGQLGSTPNHLSLSTTSTLSSSSTTSQARLVQSSLRENNGPPAPPPRSSSSGDGGNAPISCSADLGSPIWKPRDSGVGEFPQYREGGGGPRDPSEVRTRSRGAGDRPPSRSDHQRHTVGFESPHSNAKKETLQSACQMLDALLLELTAFS